MVRNIVCGGVFLTALALLSACADLPSPPVGGTPAVAVGESWTHKAENGTYELRVVTPLGLCRMPVDSPQSTIPGGVSSLDLRGGVVVPCEALARLRANDDSPVRAYTTFNFSSGVVYTGWTQERWNRAALIDSPPLLPTDKGELQKRIHDTTLQMRANDRKRFARAPEDANGFYEVEFRQGNVRPESRSMLVISTVVMKGHNFRITTHSDEIAADTVLALMDQQRTWARMLQDANRP